MTVLIPWQKPSWLQDAAGNPLPYEQLLQLTGTAVTSLTDDAANKRTVADLTAGSGGGGLTGAKYFDMADAGLRVACPAGTTTYAIALGEAAGGNGSDSWCDPTTGKILLPGVYWSMCSFTVPSGATGYGMAVGQVNYVALDLAKFDAFNSGYPAGANDPFYATEMVCLDQNDLASTWTLGWGIKLPAGATAIQAYCQVMRVAF